MDSSLHQLQMTQIKHRIDGLMDLLYGAGVASHHTIIEQINYLMFLRALTKRDDEAIKIDNADKLLFTGGFAKYRWDNLLMLNAEDLFTTLEKVYRELPEITADSTISLLYRDAHVKIYEKPTLRRLLHEIEKLMSELEADAKQGSKDIFGDMYEYLLSKQSQAGTMGQFRTPRHIIKFMTEIIDPSKGETILDPACGTAGFLVAAFKVLQQKYTSDKFKKEDRYPMDLLDPKDRKFVYEHTFTGFDSDSDMIKFGLMNLYLHQLEHPQIIRQNTLVDTAGNRDKWNIILANPPFSGALDKDSISEDLRMGTRATEILFLRYMIDHLKDNGRAGVIVPEGVIFSNSTAHKKIRQVLVDEAGLWCVVSLPAGIFNPYAGVKTSILFFDKSFKEKAKDILFVKIENDGFDLGAQKRPIDKNDLPHALTLIQEFKKWCHSRESGNLEKWILDQVEDDKSISVVSKQKIAESEDYNLSSDRYKIENILSNNKWPLVDLKDLCIKITDGSHFSPQTLAKGFPYLTVKDVVDGKLDFQNCKFISEDSYKLLVKNGCKPNINDILFSKDGTVGKVSLVDTNREFVVLSSLAILTPDNSKILPSYLKHLMQSDQVLDQALGYKTGVAIRRIILENIKKIRIPIPPLEIQHKIVDELDGYQKIINGAKQVIENWKPILTIDPQWNIVKLSSVCDVRDGTHDSPKPTSNGYPLITSKNIKDGHIDFSDVNLISEEDFRKVSKRSYVDEGDIIMPMIGTIGGACFIESKDREFAIKNVALFKKTEKIIPKYLQNILNSEFIEKKFESLASGATQKFVSLGILRTLEIPLPSLDIQAQLVEEIEKVRNLVYGNKKLIEIYEQKIKSKIAEIWGEHN